MKAVRVLIKKVLENLIPDKKCSTNAIEYNRKHIHMETWVPFAYGEVKQ